MRHEVLILSQDDVFARMLQLELLAMGISVQISAQPVAGEEAELVLLDLDSVLPTVGISCTYTVGFTRSFSISAVDPDRICSMILHRPFEMRILREEVRAMLTGTSHTEKKEELILKDAVLSYGERQVLLSRNEQKMMECFLAYRGETVTRQTLVNLIGESSANKVEVYVCYLRKKLETLTGRTCIRTLRGKGYVLYGL